MLDPWHHDHHNAADLVALINLALLTGRLADGSGLNSLRGQNNVQGGGDMGALPDRLPGFQHVEDDELRAKFEHFGVSRSRRSVAGISDMFEAMERGELTALYVIGENPAQSEADASAPCICWAIWSIWWCRICFSRPRRSSRMWCCGRRQAGANPRAL